MGAMVYLEAYCFQPATISDEGGVTWELVSPFPVTLEPSSCFSSATVWASYRLDLEGPVFLWLSKVWGTSGAGLDRSIRPVVLGSFIPV